MKRKTFSTAFGLGVAAVTAGVLTLSGVASAATIKVDHLDPMGTGATSTGWYQDDVRGTGVAEIANDHGSAPGFGSSALVLDTPESADKANAFKTVAAQDLGLGDVTAIGYRAFRSSSSTANGLQAPALNIKVDVNGLDVAGGFTTLVYEPVYNGYQSGFPVDTWTALDAYNGGNGIWWSSNPIPAAPNRDTFVSWSTIAAANPNAVILAIGANQGSGNPGLYGAIDGYVFNGDTYDFELFVPVKDDCKNNGWATKWAPGTWKNQGACVSYFAKID